MRNRLSLRRITTSRGDLQKNVKAVINQLLKDVYQVYHVYHVSHVYHAPQTYTYSPKGERLIRALKHDDYVMLKLLYVM